jgi:hypothetical protein
VGFRNTGLSLGRINEYSRNVILGLTFVARKCKGKDECSRSLSSGLTFVAVFGWTGEFLEPKKSAGEISVIGGKGVAVQVDRDLYVGWEEGWESEKMYSRILSFSFES